MPSEQSDKRMWQWTNDRPNTSAWVERIGRLEGEYGRPRFIGCATMVWITIWTLSTGAMVLFVLRVMGNVPHPPFMSIFLGTFALGFVIFYGTIWRRIGFRYVLRDGTLSALGTYGNVMWTEPLQGLQEIRYSRGRGGVRLTLVWPDRQRDMIGIASLLNALDEPGGASPTVKP